MENIATVAVRVEWKSGTLYGTHPGLVQAWAQVSSGLVMQPAIPSVVCCDLSVTVATARPALGRNRDESVCQLGPTQQRQGPSSSDLVSFDGMFKPAVQDFKTKCMKNGDANSELRWRSQREGRSAVLVSRCVESRLWPEGGEVGWSWVQVSLLWTDCWVD